MFLIVLLLVLLMMSLAVSRVGNSTDPISNFILSDGLNEGNACSIMSLPLYEHLIAMKYVSLSAVVYYGIMEIGQLVTDTWSLD